MTSNKYIPVIGLEVHIQLATQTKLFCSDPNRFEEEPNKNISEVSLAYPGAMPVLNKKAVEYAIRLGLACESRISRHMIFDRKNYFYPDLPKGYQITQDSTPICVGGIIPFKRKGKYTETVQLNRIHLEEDAGKSLHMAASEFSFIDYNRAGVPLLEMVTEPVLESPEDAASFLQEVRRLVQYLEISDGNMEEGSLRCDANISLKKAGDTELGKKVEIKNLNSFKFIAKALHYEIGRQTEILENGGEIVSETRLYNSESNTTAGMRDKETLTDYRYFPDPDLSPVEISSEEIEQIGASGKVCRPWEYEMELTRTGITEGEAASISQQRSEWEYFQALLPFVESKTAAKWFLGPVRTYLNKHKININEFSFPPENLGFLINESDRAHMHFNVASRTIFPQVIGKGEKEMSEIIAQLSSEQQEENSELIHIVKEIIQEHPKEAELLKAGKKKLMSMFMGQIMKRTGGKADAGKAAELLRKEIG